MLLYANKAYRHIFFAMLACCPLITLAQQTGTDNILSIVRNEQDNTPKSISFTANAGWKLSQAQELFARNLDIAPGGDIAMLPSHSTTTKNNVTTLRFDEYYKGIKVAYGGYTITGKDNMVSFMTGNFYAPASSLSPVPVITEAAAFANALQFVGATKYKWQNPVEEDHIKQVYHKADTSYKPKGILVWVEDIRSALNDRKLHLAYSFDIYAEEPLSRQQVYVDAITGSVLLSNKLLKHVAATGASRYSGTVPFETQFTGSTYILYNSTLGGGIHTFNMNTGTSYGASTEFTSPTNTWPFIPTDDVAIDAHWGATQVYNYWLTEQGRHSWDDLDGILLQYVHYDVNYNNAFWDGAEMTYGDGSGLAAGGFTPLTSLDVTGHEIGHGVCQATCNLLYESESGALDEAFSDCWGATIEHWGDPHEVDAMPKSYWEIGEEISTEPLRSMNSPLLQGQPNTYGSTNWFNVVACTPTGGNDQCGVHTNSGLMNYWYYLLTMGGSGTNGIGNSYIVNGVGWTTAAAVLYQTELVLSSTATYMDCRIASINTASTLYGPCSPEVQSVTSAWYAVGVGANYVPCTPQISFVTTSVSVSEKAPANTCGASKTVTISLKPTGPTITGGSPVATLVVGSTTTAVAGIDYSLSSSSVTFPAGSTATQSVILTIFDNGNVNGDKRIDLTFTVNPMGSTAEVAPINDSMTILIGNDDSIPHIGGTIYRTLDAGIPVVSDVTSPFYGSVQRARSQFLLYADELAAGGVVPGVPISQIAFTVLTKNSTAPFTGYTVSMANTAVPDLYTAFVTAGLTTVYNGNYTTNLGIDSINFNSGTFTWDGVSNVVVQLCFGSDPATFSGNDQVAGVKQGAFIIGDYATAGGGGSGCGLGYNNSNRVVIRPVMRFKQLVPPSKIETAITSTRVWNVYSGQEVYFYNPADTAVIAGIQGMDHDLGCVTATVTGQGNGMVPAAFSGINRSRKEITINPTINGAITTSDVTIYLNNTELGGVSPSTLFMLQTSAPTDATVTTSNSVVLTPTLITGGNYTGFRGTFTGYSRFMLVDGPLCNTPPALITPAGPTSFCLGSNVLLNATTGAGLGYQWQLNGSTIPGATASSYTATLGGDYTVVVNQTTCDSTTPIVTVILDSAYAAPISGSGNVCVGQTTTLSDITLGGVWNSSNTALATVSPLGVVTGIAGGAVTISYTTTNVCGSATATYSMTVNTASPVSPITGTPTVCNGASTLLNDATLGGVWITGNPSVASVSPLGNVTGVAAGTADISYKYINGTGCISYAIETATVNATPAATTSPTGSVLICTSSTQTFNASPATGFTYQWQESSIDIPGATDATYTTGTAGNYQVAITSPLGCSATSAVAVLSIDPSVVVVPSLSLTSAAGLNICASTASVMYTATPVNGGSSPTFQWSVNGLPVGGPGATYSYVPANGDVIACQLTSSSPCASPTTATASVTMTVNPLMMPSVTVNPLPNDTVCTGFPVTYTAVPAFGGTAPTYSWTENGINVGTGSSYSTTTPHNGDIIVCQINSNYSCALSPVASSAPFIMHVQPVGANTVVVSASPLSVPPGAPVTFAAIAANGGPSPEYQWFIDATPVPGATLGIFTTTSLTSGQLVYCRVITSLVCTTPSAAMSAGFKINIITTGIEPATANGSKLVLLPNPNTGSFTISGDAGFTGNEDVRIAVINLLGQEVFNNIAPVTNGAMNEHIVLPKDIVPGMYIVSVTSGTQRAVFHVTVEK